MWFESDVGALAAEQDAPRLKLFVRLPDAQAEAHAMVRLIDESGEDYLYPDDFFVPIKLPQAVEKAFAQIA
ncbi:MAG: hypothetical protein JW934_09840 [Anaerolineae bacterium]|nr:hypothetical protein [Anaerolineae bacterium]